MPRTRRTKKPTFDPMSLLGPESSEIRFVFSCFEHAETVCSEFGDPPGLFALLQPSPVLRGKAPEVIIEHMREIARRFRDGEDTRPGTDAECLAGMLGAATIHPLSSHGLALTELLFERVMKKPLHDEKLGREKYPGAIEEELSFTRRKLCVPTRTFA